METPKIVSATGGEDTAAKTPPAETSVSPEIQFGSHSKMAAALNSSTTATPVCYGAGHLLSGVSDKRKSRRRGSLRGGCEKVNSQDSSIPVLAQASVRWLLSPSDGEIHGNAFDLMSSPSAFCGNVCDLGFRNSNCSCGLFHDSEIKGLAHSSKKLESMGCCNSISTSSCDTVSSGFSVGSLSSGNVIQTPNSDEYVGWGGRRKDVVQFDIDSITETLNAVSMSPRSEMSIRDGVCDDVNSSADSVIPIRLPKDVDSVCSWVSDSSFESLALSQARISWRDGLLCKHDESDCLPCLSDEQNNGVGCSGKQIKPCQLSQSGVDEENEDNAAEMNLDVSPIVLEYEPCVSGRGKQKLSGDRLDACAESICTNGSDLAASCDSDCT